MHKIMMMSVKLNMTILRIALSAVTHCESHTLPQHVSKGIDVITK